MASSPYATRRLLPHPRALVRAADDVRAEAIRKTIAQKRVSDDAGDIKKKDKDVKAMVEYFKEGQLNLFPKYQRGYTWDEARASRLMVTALCGRTIPPVYLHEKKETDAKGRTKTVYDVVDGKQRLSSLIAFRLGHEKGRELGLHPDTLRCACKLSKLDAEEYEGWDGIRYEDMCEEDQQRFDKCDVITMTIPSSYSDEQVIFVFGRARRARARARRLGGCCCAPVSPTCGALPLFVQVFNLYEDINSGSENLSQQQLRRAVFCGAYMDLVEELRTCADFLSVRDAQALDTKKEEDGELVLRLLAFGSRHREYKGPRKTFLNDELRSLAKRADLVGISSEEYLRRQRDMFRRTMAVAVRAFGKDVAFRRWDPAKKRWSAIEGVFAELSFAALFDLLDTSQVSEQQLVARGPMLVEAIKDLFERAEQLEFKPKGRTRVAIEASLRLLKSTILDAAGGQLDAKRAFALGEPARRALWERQGRACTICGGPIREEDLRDSSALHVDHVVPHALGGATDDANAALTHRACNLSKGSRAL